jgi:hypothetical protein
VDSVSPQSKKLKKKLFADVPLLPGGFLILISVKGYRNGGHSAAGRIRSNEKSNDLNGTFRHVVFLQMYIYHNRGTAYINTKLRGL